MITGPGAVVSEHRAHGLVYYLSSVRWWLQMEEKEADVPFTAFTYSDTLCAWILAWW